MKVAAIARGVARALKLNEDLTETIAPSHSPFGNRGEDVLDRLMKDHEGFEHNRQGLRLVEERKQKYPGFPGLNPIWEVRKGLVKHYAMADYPSQRRSFDAKNACLEAQVATSRMKSLLIVTSLTTVSKRVCWMRTN